MPDRLGRYEIVERLSAGGMGEVFVARYVGPGGFVKPVALKRIHPHLVENEQLIQMLHDEANVTASIQHPSIVATVDVGHDEGEHFVVLDYVSGDPLGRLQREMKRRKGTMPSFVVAWIGAQIAGALHAAHEAKSLLGEPLEIIHRDVSLGNIMLSDAGHPMLLDFGVAKAKQSLHQTAHGELKGKFSYMAPETFRGAPVNRSVDVFALGVVLYELLTQISPFQRGSDVETITALQSAEVASPSEQNPAIDPRLSAIVLTAMARDRAQRYATAKELEEALRYWAREAAAPHDAGPVVAWLAEKFPERLASRRALLARIANPERQPLRRHAPPGGQTPVPTSTSQPGREGTPLSVPSLASAPWTPAPSSVLTPAGVFTPSGAGPQITPYPGSASNASVGPVASLAADAQLEAGGQRRSTGRLVAAVVFLLGLGGLLAYFTLQSSAAPAAAGGEATAPSGSAAPPSTIAAALVTALAAPSALPSGTASAAGSGAAAAHTARPAGGGKAPPPSGDKGKGKGPIVRSYD